MDEISVNDDDDHVEEDEDWDIVLSSRCSKQSPFQPPSENHNDAGEIEDDDGYDDDYDDNYDDDDDDDVNDGGDDRDKLELGCPYCTENLDVLGLCCHIDDQHYKEAKSGICPICSKKLETSMTVHIIAQHESILRTLCKKKFRGGGTNTDLHLLKIKESSRSQLGASSRADHPLYDLSTDLLLLSFVQNSRPTHRPETVQAGCPIESGLSENSSNDVLVERSREELSTLTDKLQDKARICEFVNGLVFSTIFDDGS